MTRVPIRYSFGKGLILRCVGVPARAAYVDVDETVVRVRMGWAFRAAFDRSRVESAYHAPNVRITAHTAALKAALAALSLSHSFVAC